MIIKERVNTFSKELIEKFKAVEPPTVGHFRHDGFMNPRIRPLFPEALMVGPAVMGKTTAE